MRFFNLTFGAGEHLQRMIDQTALFFCGTGCVGHLIKVDVEELHYT